MPLSPEQLLIPRFECIGNKINHFPGSPFNVGQIIALNETHCGQKNIPCHKEQTDEGIDTWFLSDFTDYPHLFKPLPWHSHRAIEDMPEYVKWVKKYDAIPVREYGDVMKVKEWGSNSHFICGNDEGWKLTGRWFEPATIQDYTDYVNAKNKI